MSATCSYTILTGDKSVAGSIKNWVNYSKFDAGGVLADAQSLIYVKLRVREMRTTDSWNVAAGADYTDVPDGYLQTELMRNITAGEDVEEVDWTKLERMRTWDSATYALDSGDPAYFGVSDEQFNFDVKTTTAWRLRLAFYQRLDPLAAGNPVNFLTEKYSHVLRMACLATAARFSKDDEVFVREQQLCYAEIERINAMDEMTRAGMSYPVTGV